MQLFQYLVLLLINMQKMFHTFYLLIQIKNHTIKPIIIITVIAGVVSICQAVSNIFGIICNQVCINSVGVIVCIIQVHILSF